MKLFIGADHRGFELKQSLIEFLKSQGHEVEDCGNTVFDPLDDYPDFAKKVAQSVIASEARQSSALGIVICGSGVGVSVAANRYKGIVCALGFDISQVAHARENDSINVLSIPSDYVEIEKAKEMILAFINGVPKTEEKYLRRLAKLDA